MNAHGTRDGGFSYGHVRYFVTMSASQEALMINSAKQHKRNKDKVQEARMMEKATWTHAVPLSLLIHVFFVGDQY